MIIILGAIYSAGLLLFALFIFACLIASKIEDRRLAKRGTTLKEEIDALLIDFE